MTLFYNDLCLTCRSYVEAHDWCRTCRSFTCEGSACWCEKGDAA